MAGNPPRRLAGFHIPKAEFVGPPRDQPTAVGSETDKNANGKREIPNPLASPRIPKPDAKRRPGRGRHPLPVRTHGHPVHRRWTFQLTARVEQTDLRAAGISHLLSVRADAGAVAIARGVQSLGRGG